MSSPEAIIAKAKRPRIILVTGLKRSGKDFVSSKLHEALSTYHPYSFAYPLKDIICKSFGVTPDYLGTAKNNNALILANGTYLTDFRTLLQRFGTEAMKPWFGDSVWVDLFKRVALPHQSYIISDWRFAVEYYALTKQFNITTIRVVDNNLIADSHASESELINFPTDFTIDNTAKDDSILPQIQQIANHIKGL